MKVKAPNVRKRSLGALVAVALVSGPVATPGAVAQVTPGGAATVSITARDQPVGAFLRDLFGRTGRPVIASRNLSGTVNGVFSGTVDRIFRDIARAFNLVSYDDGAALYVYASNELGVQTIPAADGHAARVLARVRALRLGNERNTLRAAADGSLVASGTPRFLEQVATLARGAAGATPALAGAGAAPRGGSGLLGGYGPGAPAAPVQPLEFRVFYLRYAQAQDTTVYSGSQQLTVPGLATVLQNLVLDQRPGGSAAPNAPQFGARLVRQSQPRLKGFGFDSVQPNGQQTPLLGLPLGGAYPQTGDVLGAPAGGGGDLVAPLTQDVVRIEPSPQLNAVVVRDVPERMAAYDSLIRALDVEPQVVEVDATIIDIDTTKLRNLGINWRFGSGGFGALFGSGDADSDGRLNRIGGGRRGNVDNITPSAQGGAISAIIGNSREFIGRLNALERKNVARVVARPQVMTLSNVEALFDRTRTFYVRVAGRQEVDLFNVTAGTIMRVTPHVFRDHDQTRIRVRVTIEDGAITSDRVDGLPVVDRASVTNQTMVQDGQSLLLGGMTVDEDSDVEYKIPLLGDIPVLGNLFKSRSRSRGRIERLFLISPRVVDVGANTSVATMQVPATPLSAPLTPGTRVPAAPAQPAAPPPTAPQPTAALPIRGASRP
ncbi:type III secretion system outer membrane ring subunit SctC [Sphingomonas sp. BK235]|uniref:type III secretion system outer membrane ring subunit SctC n=1 Tax=Sphingomonas sp. BK235 TaxID=2512131 RepID=UPI00105092EA|nr:type III secretion system outer membrane ring subunit SctC [Sphingomonas sp. BK235]TCP34357.1 type III secretion protein C [Sphingomonas sp. BK235]